MEISNHCFCGQDNLRPETREKIKKDLTLKQFDRFLMEYKADFVMYEIDSKTKRWKLPRAYGIHLFAPIIKSCKDNRSIGLSMNKNLVFTQQLDEKNRKQKTATDQCFKYIELHGGCILNTCVGSGKTQMGLYIAFTLGRKTLWIQHKGDLLIQSLNRAMSVIPGIRCGTIKGKIQDTDNKDIVFATVQTLFLHKDRFSVNFFDQFGTVVVDEMHHYAADTFSKVIQAVRPKNLIGLSATVKRKDGLTDALTYMFGPTITVDIERKQDVYVSMLQFDFGRRKEYFLKWDHQKHNYSKMLASLQNDPLRNQMIIEYLLKLYALHRKVLVLSLRTDHCSDLQAGFESKIRNLESRKAAALIQVIRPSLSKTFIDQLTKNFLNTPFISSVYTSKTASKKHKNKTEDLLKKQFIFSTCQMASEGLDLKDHDTVFFVLPPQNVQQCIGRILRSAYTEKNPDKYAWVVDIHDTFSVFHGSSFKRTRFYVQEEYMIEYIRMPAYARNSKAEEATKKQSHQNVDIDSS